MRAAGGALNERRDALAAHRHPNVRQHAVDRHYLAAYQVVRANGTAVRELDMHDIFLAADYSHLGDNIPPPPTLAQRTGDGAALLRGLATGYEIQINLVRAICLHEHKMDHIAHLCPAAAELGALLNLDRRRSTERCSRRYT